ncbi:MAG: hypothetical protein BWZ11_01884 [Bacteroidetes bacterium ADurb.BinA395]|jgi:hypothetical protein|nr:MAG: hypothetical protein BWZ11_01884 [Bacteroidetes bacterium ADurb.BinA395]
MKNQTEYQEAKSTLKNAADYAKSKYQTDKPAIRMEINDTADWLCKELRLSEYHRGLLSNYACKLHPKG